MARQARGEWGHTRTGTLGRAHTDHTAPVQFDKLFEIEGQAIRVFNWAGSH